MKITNKEVAYLITIGIPSIAFFYIGFAHSFYPSQLHELEFYFMEVIMMFIYITLGCLVSTLLFGLIVGMFTDDIEFEINILNPFKKGRYLTEEEQKHFEEYLKERNK